MICDHVKRKHPVFFPSRFGRIRFVPELVYNSPNSLSLSLFLCPIATRVARDRTRLPAEDAYFMDCSDIGRAVAEY